jgi:telomere length regulation protein
MATDPEVAQTRVREIVNRLQVPVPDLPTLLSLLASPLASLHLLPPRYRQYNINPLQDGDIHISKHVPLLQRALLQHIIPTWESVLAEENATPLLQQYFCPDPFSFASPAAGEVTLLAYSSILSSPFTGYSIRMLVHLAREYPIDRLHTTLFSQVNFALGKRLIAWEDAVRNVVGVPAKVANALSGKDIPNELQHAAYFDSLSTRCEVLMCSLSSNPSEGSSLYVLDNCNHSLFVEQTRSLQWSIC